MQILLAVIVANIVVSLTDWYFFGILWHDKYEANPEVWRRPEGGPGENKAVFQSAVVGALTPTVFVLVCVLLNLVRLQDALLLGAAIWLIGPLPMWVWSYIFMKLHPLILLSGILGWLVRLGVSALTVAILLG